MPNIKITVADKRAALAEDTCIVCGNSDYTVTFIFDEEWADHPAKTARFKYKSKGVNRYTDVVFNGDTCKVPVLVGTHEVRVGVYAGNLQTTTGATIPCERSIRCSSPLHTEPPKDVYDQLMESIESGMLKGEPGEPGKDGHTPEKGVDYNTPEDKAEMVEMVLAALPNGDEVSY